MTSADQAERLRQLALNKNADENHLPNSPSSCAQSASTVCVEMKTTESTHSYDEHSDSTIIADNPCNKRENHLDGNSAPKRHTPNNSHHRAVKISGVNQDHSRKRTTYITVTSGKGGVGKTNVAVNLAVAIAQTGRRVTLIDADLGTANADVICGITSTQNLSHVLNGRRQTLGEVAVEAPGGFRLVPGANGIRRFADLSQNDRASLIRELTALEQTSDTIIIDTGAGIGSGVTAMTAMADIILVVLTPEPTSLTDGYGLIKAIHASSSPGRPSDQRLAVLVNMVSSRRQARAVYDRISTVARRFLGFHIDLAGSIPMDPHVSRSVLKRSPFILNCPHAPSSTSMMQLSERLLRSVSRNIEHLTPNFTTESVPDPVPETNGSGYFNRFRRWLKAGSAS